MKFNNRFIFVIVGAIILYAIFLLLSDVSLILSKIPNLKTEYLPIILILIPSSWLFLFLRWNLLLKNSNIKIPLKENLKIYFAGFALAVTPGKFGELIKSQIMKTKFDVPHRTTSSLVLVERLYDLAGAIVVSFIGILLIGIGEYVIAGASIVLISIFVMISSKKLFQNVLKIIGKIGTAGGKLNLLKNILFPYLNHMKLFKLLQKEKLFLRLF